MQMVYLSVYVKQWGSQKLSENEKFKTHLARGQNMKELDLLIEQWTKSQTAKETLNILAQKGVPSGLIYSAKEMLEDPQYKAREMIVEVEHEALGKVPMPGIVPKLSRTPGAIQQPGGIKMGERNEEIYRSLGLTEQQLAELKEANII